MRINHNSSAEIANRSFYAHNEKASKCIYRLSTGKRINDASDDPAGMAKATKLKAMIRGLDVHIRANEKRQDELKARSQYQDGQNNIIQGMRELAVQISSDTCTELDRKLLINEYMSLLEELGNRTFSETGMEIVVDDSGEVMFLRDGKVFVGGEWVDTAKAADELKDKKSYSDLLSYAESMLRSGVRVSTSIGAELEALARRLDSLYQQQETAMSSLSIIEDADMAKEIMELVREKMLSQVSATIASLANLEPERVLLLIDAI